MNLSRGLVVLTLLAILGGFAAFKFAPTTTSATSVISTAAEVGPADNPLQLNIIARVGPWPVASRLIGYQGRLWFANSVKFRNHNSADIWSLDPASGKPRYERNLFSQDVGVPLIHNGLLHWPLEDALHSMGHGMIAATDGEMWQPLLISSATIYHTSELLEWQGDLLAMTATRNVGLQLSKDGGRNWKQLYIHPTPTTHISRLKDMVVLNGKIYALLRDAKVLRLAVWTGSGFRTVTNWPPKRHLRGLTVHKDAMFVIVGRGEGREVWKSDGTNAVKISREGTFADLASDGERLWIVSQKGRLWSRSDDNLWSRHGDLKNGEPMSIHSIAGGIYVAGTGDDDRGIIWGPDDHVIPAGSPPPAITKQFPSKQVTVDWTAAGEKLDRMLSDVSSYEARGNAELRGAINDAIVQRAPNGFFAERLKAQIPVQTVSAFGGNMQLQASDIAQSILFWAMGQAGHPNVPPDYLKQPWTAQPNSYEKYIAPHLGALRAVALSGQNDAATINALLARLDFANDPEWLRSQVIGTLTAVSGEHFGYDIAAWKQWARSQPRDEVLARR